VKTRFEGFDRLASVYRRLEWLAFGSNLETARFCHLDHLRERRHVLLLGEGDGRFLVQLVRRFPHLNVVCMDASAVMLKRAKARLTAAECSRVTFRNEDVLLADFGVSAYDAVVTLFFLDCFTAEELAGLINRVRVALREDACWLCADFALPLHGWRRWRAELWLRGLYLFFRWQTKLTARELPPMERLLCEAGFELRAEESRQSGLLRSAVFGRRRLEPICASRS
jgi:cyclopropane fatty-acyl-phospholipid synthase-like methyltransferase